MVRGGQEDLGIIRCVVLGNRGAPLFTPSAEEIGLTETCTCRLPAGSNGRLSSDPGASAAPSGTASVSQTTASKPHPPTDLPGWLAGSGRCWCRLRRLTECLAAAAVVSPSPVPGRVARGRCAGARECHDTSSTGRTGGRCRPVVGGAAWHRLQQRRQVMDHRREMADLFGERRPAGAGPCHWSRPRQGHWSAVVTGALLLLGVGAARLPAERPGHGRASTVARCRQGRRGRRRSAR